MRITVAAVGKARDAALAAAITDYQARAARYWPLRFVEVRAEPGAGGPQQVQAREGERLRAAVTPATRFWLCDETGASHSSVDFATWLQSLREAAHDVGFFVGGAFGHGDSLRAAAAGSLSLSPMTLPHDVAQLVLAEQLYRAGTIVRGEPYHKA